MASKVEQFLSEIRELQGLKNAILCGITLTKKEKTAEFFLVTDKTYSASEEAQAREICQAYLPSGLSAELKIVKRVPDAEGLKERIFAYIQKNFPAAAAFLEKDGVEVEMLQSGANFYVDIASGEQS